MNKKYFILIFFVALIVSVHYSPVGHMVTFENLKRHREELLAFVQGHYLLSVVLFVGTYVAGTALSLPAAAIFTMSGGFLFGSVAVLFVNVGATTGATLSFLASRYLLGTALQEKYKIQLSAFNREIQENGPRYLLTLRLIPVFPFFLINFLSGLTNLPLRTFIWTTALGIIPSSSIFSYAGRQIGSINSPAEVFSARVISAFAFLALLAISPVVVRTVRMRSRPKSCGEGKRE